VREGRKRADGHKRIKGIGAEKDERRRSREGITEREGEER